MFRFRLFSALLALALAGSLSANSSSSMLVYFGTFTPSAPHHGIFAAQFDLASGRFTVPQPVSSLEDPSFLALGHDRRTLFAVGAASGAPDQPAGVVVSYQIDAATGKLQELSRQPNGSVADCHVSLSPDGRTLFTAHYNDGFAGSFPLSAEGRVGARASRIQHVGTSVNKQRQERPHVHGMTPSPDGRFVFAPDLGIDRVVAYRVNADSTLSPVPEADLATPAGQGPRHVTFSPDGRFLYEINELVACIRVHRYDAATGRATFVEQVSTLPEGFKGRHSGAEVLVHPSGRWLYASNREEHQSVAVFAIDAQSGRLTLLQHWTPGLVHPRFITVDPSGRWFICTNTFGDSVVTAAIDPASGRLGEIVSKISLPKPSCVVFVP